MIYSLFARCKKHNVNAQDWLVDVLRKINDVAMKASSQTCCHIDAGEIGNKMLSNNRLDRHLQVYYK
jgi:hypothetical protein